MPKNTAIPYFQAGPFTGIPTADVIGKRLVSYAPGGKGTAPKIVTAAAGAVVAGVAAHDSLSGVPVNVETNGVIPITAGGALAANDRVAAGALGVAVKAVDPAIVIGICVADAAINTDAPIRLV